MFGNVMQDYDRASSEDVMTIKETCRQTNTNLSNLPLHYQQSTRPFIIDWCKIYVSHMYSY